MHDLKMEDRPLMQRRDAWFHRFHRLMPFRVREVLLVSSQYDAFILEEDGHLTERLFTEYSELNLSSAPRITHTSSAAEAMEMMAERPFDLVITMVRLEDMDVTAFGHQVKEAHPGMPFVLMAFTEAELIHFGSLNSEVIDHVFVWAGDAQILLGIIKLIEDQRNVEPDTRNAEVRVILFVEDSVQRYSSFVSLLYGELMLQSQELISEGVNNHHKLMRMRGRPRLLLATNYEEAMEYFEKYGDYLMALISDIRFPREGETDAQAGFRLVEAFREKIPDLPILLQSAEPENRPRARQMKVHFATKKSESLQRELRAFMKGRLGFGSFIFRLPDGNEVARARDTFDMEEILASVPAASLFYHASRNDFSTWLMTRSLIVLAQRVKATSVNDFDDMEGVRQYLIRALRGVRILEQREVITDFTPRQKGPETAYLRIGSGSLGGKARSIAFANSVLASLDLVSKYPDFEVKTPRTLVICTGEFDRYLEDSAGLTDVEKLSDDDEVMEHFLDAHIPEDLFLKLEMVCKTMRGPLAVRSSGLLEDSHIHPFAGIYSTYMLPNNHPEIRVRLREIVRAIKAVYASAFSMEARAYLADTPFSYEEEKLAVMIQEMVGSRHGSRFYPNFSGVALSDNYYPVGYQKPEEGVALVALGMGHQIVQGGSALLFSPSTPKILPQYPSPREFLAHSQNHFYALDMTRPTVNFFDGPDSSLKRFPLSAAEEDGMLTAIASTYVAGEDRIRDSLTAVGARLLTFNNILRWESIPLAPVLAELLQVFREALACGVEIEFSVDLGDLGKSLPRGQPRRSPCLYVLQVRPQGSPCQQSGACMEGVEERLLLARTPRSLGNGRLQNLVDVVYVKPRDLNGVRSAAVATQVGYFNQKLREAGRRYLLVGPGRWGSSDVHLGIPVEWSQISRARVIIETSFAGRIVEPSQGSHFFHNITARQIGYLTMPPESEGPEDERGYLDMDWFDQQPFEEETEDVRHIRLEFPLTVLLDGAKGEAVVLKGEDPYKGAEMILEEELPDGW
jgi:hypothetical protein